MKIRASSVLVGGLIILGIIVVAGASLFGSARKSSNGKVQIVASFYPMAEFARHVGGSRVDVTTLVKPGVEPHDYEPSPQDMAKLHSARIFIYNGAGLEQWVNKVTPDLGGVTIVDASHGIALQPADPSAGEHSPTDPHV